MIHETCKDEHTQKKLKPMTKSNKINRELRNSKRSVGHESDKQTNRKSITQNISHCKQLSYTLTLTFQQNKKRLFTGKGAIPGTSIVLPFIH